MNPHSINLHIQAYNRRKRNEFEEMDAYAHLFGMYTTEALFASVGNMLAENGQKKMEYPKKPYGIRFDFDDESKQQAVDEFFAEQDALRRKWRLKKNKNEN